MTDANVRCGDRFTSLTDVQLQAARIATGLRSLGAQQGDAVALLLRNDIPFITATLGAATAGARPTPINFHSSAEEVGYVLADSGAKVLVGHTDLLRSLPPSLTKSLTTVHVETPPDIADAFGLSPDDGAVPDSELSWSTLVAGHDPLTDAPGGSPFSVIYTSGTTGHPKGVKRAVATPEQQSRLAQVAARVLGLRPGSTMLIATPLYHSAPNSAAVFAVHLGCSVVLVPRFEPEVLLELIEAHRVTTALMVPTMFNRLVKLPDEVKARYDLSSIEHVIHTAAPCPNETKRRMIEWWGPVICESYASTEVGSVTFCTSEEWLERPGTVGRPLPEATIKILDAEGKELPIGEVGEVFARLDAIADFTYHDKDELRREVETGGLITSGDVGYIDEDGYLFLCDRKRDMVIFGGTNVYPAEIEAVLVHMPGVTDCAVFGIPDEDFGEVLAAVVQPDPGADIDADDVRAYLAEHLAGYKVPKVVELRDELPREDSGKLLKRKLRDPYWVAAGRHI
ncbi:MAG TPA: acyl-CoA synthetase [Mycobacterium sp.]|jgi:long-chain acyl-CoA synthetase|uniref:acyl-CoA synthetase n=1 Tax=Mycobacterium sp. TaxID=1785 RepID=UPI002F42F6CD